MPKAADAAGADSPRSSVGSSSGVATDELRDTLGALMRSESWSDPVTKRGPDGAKFDLDRAEVLLAAVEQSPVVRAAIATLESQGAEIREITLPRTALAVPAYYIIAPAECSSNLSRFDGVRYGHRSPGATSLETLYGRSRAEGFGPEVKRRIMIGTYALSAGYYDAYYLKAQKIRRLIAEDFKRAFADVDVIVGPTSPTVAFGLGERTEDPVSMYLSDIYTISVNLAGLPGLSIPAGFAHGLPVGLQLIGDFFSEN